MLFKPPFPLPPRQGMLRGMPYLQGLWGVGVISLVSVRPEPPSRSDRSCCMQHAATRLTHISGRVWWYVVPQARSRTLRAHFAGAATQQCTIGMLVRGGRRYHQPNYVRHSLITKLDSTTEEEGDRASTGGKQTDGTFPERQLFLFLRSLPQLARSVLF